MPFSDGSRNHRIVLRAHVKKGISPSVAEHSDRHSSFTTNPKLRTQMPDKIGLDVPPATKIFQLDHVQTV
jgi:hypothetical protein